MPCEHYFRESKDCNHRLCLLPSTPAPSSEALLAHTTLQPVTTPSVTALPPVQNLKSSAFFCLKSSLCCYRAHSTPPLPAGYPDPLPAFFPDSTCRLPSASICHLPFLSSISFPRCLLQALLQLPNWYFRPIVMIKLFSLPRSTSLSFW